MPTITDDLRHVSAPEIRHQALSLGFDLCGIAPAAAYPELQFFRKWLDLGYAGDMDYLHRSAERRMDVTQVLPAARSIIALGTIYNVDRPYSTENRDRGRAAIARYAWGEDYHTVIQQRLAALTGWIAEHVGEGFESRAYVDTGPVQERVFAQYAGLGWIGKNTCLINEDRGSWLFLSEIICNLPLVADAPALNQCGSCTLCLEACPTGALVAPYQLDSRRCISYLTIELKHEIPVEHRAAIGEHAYGCDICQEVCPWNLTPGTGTSTDPAWLPRTGLDEVALLDLWRATDDELRGLLKGSAMKRAGVRRLRRNIAVAIGNAGDATAGPVLEASEEPTTGDPLVATHVRWAVQKLSGPHKPADDLDQSG